MALLCSGRKPWLAKGCACLPCRSENSSQSLADLIETRNTHSQDHHLSGSACTQRQPRCTRALALPMDSESEYGSEGEEELSLGRSGKS